MTTFTKGPVDAVQCRCCWLLSIRWLAHSCCDKVPDDARMVVNAFWSTWWCRQHPPSINKRHALGDDRQAKHHRRGPELRHGAWVLLMMTDG